LPFLQPEIGGWIYAIAATVGFMHAAAITLPWAIVPDVVEFDELKSGERREGLFYGGTTFSYKAATGLAFLISTSVLQLTGYAAGVAQTPLALGAIRVLTGPFPALALLGAVFLAMRYPLTRERHAQIVAALKERQAHG
ncbi:MAG: MFS transporter, partial [Bdellovibrionales bacterium]|nr:MFS transporter [Bdellovibrionales bacterium]